MLSNKFRFRIGTVGDVPNVIRLIESRIEWMDCNGINQWNKNHYRERYPDSYYVQAADKGQLYVLVDKESGRIIAGAVLLTQDYRWGVSDDRAYYVHNLVSDIELRDAGKEMMRQIENYAELQDMRYVRLDCIVGNQRLNAWYENLGYEYVRTITDGEYQGNLREKELMADVRGIIAKLVESSDNFYIYDECRIKKCVSRLQSCFPQIKFLYSIKCNNNYHVLRSVFSQGLGADAASVREVYLASECGLPKDDIYYSAPGKTRKDIEGVLGKSIIIADSINEIKLIDNIAHERGEVYEIGIRLNPDFTFYSETGTPSKFGIDETQAVDFINSGQCRNVRICGIHVHLRSQELNPTVLERYYEKMIGLAERFSRICGPLKYVNMGSGMGIQYSKANTPLNVPKLAEAVNNKLLEFQKTYPDTLLIIETGRYVVGESGMYVTTVLDRKVSQGKTFVILKNTLNGFARPSLERLVVHYSPDENPSGCEPLYSCKNAFDFLTLKEEPCETEKVTLVGNLCTSSDVVAEGIEMPRLEAGDTVIITNAGAYGAVLSPMQFSSQDKPDEYFLSEEEILSKDCKCFA